MEKEETNDSKRGRRFEPKKEEGESAVAETCDACEDRKGAKREKKDAKGRKKNSKEKIELNNCCSFGHVLCGSEKNVYVRTRAQGGEKSPKNADRKVGLLGSIPHNNDVGGW